MTLVIGYGNGTDAVWIGSDAADPAYRYEASNSPKVLRRGTALIGTTHQLVLGHMADETLAPRQADSANSLLRRMFNPSWLEAAVSVCKAWPDTSEEFIMDVMTGLKRVALEAADEFMVMVGLWGRVWILTPGSVIQPTAGYAAIGTGRDYALGAMDVIARLGQGLTGEQMIAAALNAAATHDINTRGPGSILSSICPDSEDHPDWVPPVIPVPHDDDEPDEGNGDAG